MSALPILAMGWFPTTLVLLAGLFFFGLMRALGTENQIQRHWSHLIDGLSYSPQKFYSAVELFLEERRIPSATYGFIEIREHGPLSAKRLYLRVARYGQRMDICAAPFGSGFFVSWWLIVPPSWLRLTPIIGWIVDALLPETYFTMDTAIMFQSAVHQAVQEVLDDVTASNGLRVLNADERKPILKGFSRM